MLQVCRAAGTAGGALLLRLALKTGGEDNDDEDWNL